MTASNRVYAGLRDIYGTSELSGWRKMRNFRAGVKIKLGTHVKVDFDYHPPPDASAIVQKRQPFYGQAGMERCCVI
jgi:hypothetical protein